MDKLAVLLEKLKTLNIPFTRYNHIKTVDVGVDYAVTQLDVHPDSLNYHGMIHGACLYALADNACGAAAHTDGRNYVTQHGNLHFITNQGQGVIVAKATVRHRGHATCVIAVDVFGDNGRLLSVGEFTFYCVGEM